MSILSIKNKTASASAQELKKQVRALFEEFSGSALCGEQAIHIAPGDWYWAQRNGPPRILQCRRNNKQEGWIIATVNAYPYDTGECFRLKKGVDIKEIKMAAAQADFEFAEWSRWSSEPAAA